MSRPRVVPRQLLRRLAVLVPTVAACLTAGASCTSSEHGLSVEIRLAPPATPASENGARTFSSDQGYEVVLSRGYLAVGSVALGECDSARVAPSLELPLGVKSAFAHSMSSPTRLGEPGVISLTGTPDDAFLLGKLEPPPGDYCALTVSLAAADGDALHLPTDVDFVGLTLYVEGTYRKGDGQPVPFETSTDSALDGSPTIAELSLGEDADTVVTFSIGSKGEHWFDGVDFETEANDAVAERVLENVAASLDVVRE
jgi:hypothetical protein